MKKSILVMISILGMAAVVVAVLSLANLDSSREQPSKGFFNDVGNDSEQANVLPTQEQFNFNRTQFEHACTKDQICYGIFGNGTKMRISCAEIPVHGCGVMSFDKPEIHVKSVSRINTDQYLLEISELQGNYIQNEEIRFDVHEKGFDIRCFSIYAEIYDSSGNKMLEQSKVMECVPGLGKSNFDNVIPFSGIRIDKASEYRLVVQSRGYEITRMFSVIDQNLVR